MELSQMARRHAVRRALIGHFEDARACLEMGTEALRAVAFCAGAVAIFLVLFRLLPLG